MRKFIALCLLALVLAAPAETEAKRPEAPQTIANQWFGKRVAYLGDSITDERQTKTQRIYWQYLEELLGIVPTVYGISGNQWHHIIPQAKRLQERQGDEVDAIFIFIGTNDFNAGVPIGEWYTETAEQVEILPGTFETRKRRDFVTDEGTVCGRINNAMAYLKRHYPTKQIILLTPIHRALFRSSSTGKKQPDERYANKIGHYLSEYLAVYRQIGNIWAVPVIDLNSVCGLYPVEDAHAPYFRDADTDRLHPNSDGHYRMAKALMYQLLAHPADFE